MYELVITCLKCGAQKSVHHLPEKAELSDTDVIAQAGHTPQCKLRGATNVVVARESRPDEPHVSLYTVKEG